MTIRMSSRFDQPKIAFLGLLFVSVPEPKTIKNRLHLDLPAR